MALSLLTPPFPLERGPMYQRIILGCDTGFKSFGWGLISFSEAGASFHSCGLITTEKSTRKVEVRASSDNMARGRALIDQLLKVVAEAPGKIVCIAVEGQSLVRNASVNLQLGMAFMAVCFLSVQLSVPVVEFSPQELKQQIAGSKSATKAEVLAALNRRPGMVGLRAYLQERAEIRRGRKSELPEGSWEHPVDAVAAAVCALNSDIVRMLRGS